MTTEDSDNLSIMDRRRIRKRRQIEELLDAAEDAFLSKNSLHHLIQAVRLLADDKLGGLR